MQLSARQWFFTLFIVCGLLIGFLSYFPDNKLHLIFCNVGQGDAAYIRFPNQTDMLIDGGPDDVIGCLSKHMPFNDRTIDVVVMTHPQKDHLGGLVNVLHRYTIKHFVTVPVGNQTGSFKELVSELKNQQLIPSYLTAGAVIKFGTVTSRVLWPEKEWLIDTLHISDQALVNNQLPKGKILAFTSDKDLNLFSLYLDINYNNFHALFTGDGDKNTQNLLVDKGLWDLLPKQVNVLKVPHHGSKTGMTEAFIETVAPHISIIEVGKNNYGHPNRDMIEKLQKWGQVLRTDKEGDIEIITDGKTVQIKHN